MTSKKLCRLAILQKQMKGGGDASFAKLLTKEVLSLVYGIPDRRQLR